MRSMVSFTKSTTCHYNENWDLYHAHRGGLSLTNFQRKKNSQKYWISSFKSVERER